VSRGAVLVTGAAGFIGAHTVRACRAAGWSVTALDIRETAADLAESTAVVRAEADAPAVLADLRAGRYAAVVHQGAISNTLEQNWDRLRRVNVAQSLRLAEACARSGAVFLYASSHSVYGTIHQRLAVAEQDEDDPTVCTGPLNLYARSKLELDRAMTDRFGADAAWAGLRYTNVFGTGETRKGTMASIISQLLRDAARGHPLRLFADTLEAARDYVPVETVVGNVLRILDRGIPPGVYNLGSGHPVTFATLLRWCADFDDGVGLTVRLVPNPIPARYQYWTCADQAKLDAVLPDRPIATRADLQRAARRLYGHYRADGAEHTGRVA
jgi:ADP-L-glycero-D-manno-heptose 6-epimerase